MINQCRIRQLGLEPWMRVEWLPSKDARDARVGKVVTVDGVIVRDDLFKKQE